MQVEFRLRLLEEKIDYLIELIEPARQDDYQEVDNSKPINSKSSTRDWSQVSNDELFGLGEYERPVRGTGASNERIERAVKAIIDYNNQFPTHEMRQAKWLLDKFAVRRLSGCNGQVIARWFDEHHELVSHHNHKHGLIDAFHNRDNHQREEIRNCLMSEKRQ